MTVMGMVVAAVLAAWAGLLFVPLRWRPVGMILFVPRLFAQAWSPFIGLAAVAVAILGAVTGSWWTVGLATLAAVEVVVVMARLGALAWPGRLPRVRQPRMRADVGFWRIPGTDRVLLCDVWEPPTGVAPSGVGIVHLHSSAWTVFDKDAGTRPLFRQLAARGHVVMDVAYRLFPETDIPGMVHDAQRAIAWLRANAAELEVDPDRIVLAGGSAGAHLALLTAYTPDDPTLAPLELGVQPGVAGVVSLYGQADLAAMYDATDQAITAKVDDPQPDWDAPTPSGMVKVLGPNAARYRMQLIPYAGRCDWLIGGTPDEVPHEYERLSPLARVDRDCPPTLLVHGQLDMMAPIGPVRRLADRLREDGVPIDLVELPHTDHAFDLVSTTWAPPARASIDALLRFLDTVAKGGGTGRTTTSREFVSQ